MSEQLATVMIVADFSCPLDAVKAAIPTEYPIIFSERGNSATLRKALKLAYSVWTEVSSNQEATAKSDCCAAFWSEDNPKQAKYTKAAAHAARRAKLPVKEFSYDYTPRAAGPRIDAQRRMAIREHLESLSAEQRVELVEFGALDLDLRKAYQLELDRMDKREMRQWDSINSKQAAITQELSGLYHAYFTGATNDAYDLWKMESKISRLLNNLGTLQKRDLTQVAPASRKIITEYEIDAAHLARLESKKQSLGVRLDRRLANNVKTTDLETRLDQLQMDIEATRARMKQWKRSATLPAPQSDPMVEFELSADDAAEVYNSFETPADYADFMEQLRPSTSQKHVYTSASSATPIKGEIVYHDDHGKGYISKVINNQAIVTFATGKTLEYSVAELPTTAKDTSVSIYTHTTKLLPATYAKITWDNGALDETKVSGTDLIGLPWSNEADSMGMTCLLAGIPKSLEKRAKGYAEADETLTNQMALKIAYMGENLVNVPQFSQSPRMGANRQQWEAKREANDQIKRLKKIKHRSAAERRELAAQYRKLDQLSVVTFEVCRPAADDTAAYIAKRLYGDRITMIWGETEVSQDAYAPTWPSPNPKHSDWKNAQTLANWIYKHLSDEYMYSKIKAGFDLMAEDAKQQPISIACHTRHDAEVIKTYLLWHIADQPANMSKVNLWRPPVKVYPLFSLLPQDCTGATWKNDRLLVDHSSTLFRTRTLYHAIGATVLPSLI